MSMLLVFLVATLIVVRGGILKHTVLTPLSYRFAIYGTVQLSYFFLASLLPLVNGTTLDAELYRLDTGLFGVEPAMAMDAIVSSLTTEWFAFFYYGYFFVLALHVIPILMFARHPRVVGEFALGMLTVFCLGHIGYMLVPGFGPYRAMADHFQHALPSGMWMDLVRVTVASGGAQMDIFPSLHTAAPTFIAIYSFRHRQKLPFRYTWPVVALFAVNIIIATMFLRWHYVIDVVAGLCLAALALFVAKRATDFELARRERAQLMPSWPEFSLPRSREHEEAAPDRASAHG
jgi:membrane-associated phospholipid phosphatase